MAMKDWSFKSMNDKPGSIQSVDPLEILLFNKLKSTKLYSKLAKNMTWDEFQEYTFEDPTVSGGNGLKRYLKFICYDMCGRNVELSFIVNAESHDILKSLLLELTIVNKKVSCKRYTDNFHLAGDKSTDKRLYANL